MACVLAESSIAITPNREIVRDPTTADPANTTLAQLPAHGGLLLSRPDAVVCADAREARASA